MFFAGVDWVKVYKKDHCPISSSINAVVMARVVCL